MSDSEIASTILKFKVDLDVCARVPLLLNWLSLLVSYQIMGNSPPVPAPGKGAPTENRLLPKQLSVEVFGALARISGKSPGALTE